MSGYTKRLQLLLSPEQYRKVELYARKRKKSIVAVIREALEKMLREPSRADKKKAVKRLLSHELPVAEWEKMEKEITEGAIHQ